MTLQIYTKSDISMIEFVCIRHESTLDLRGNIVSRDYLTVAARCYDE